MTKKEVAEHVFARYPKQNTVFVTSDNQGFFTAPEAEAHAPRLKDKSIETFNRKVEEIKVVDAEELGDGTNTKPFEKITGEGLAAKANGSNDIEFDMKNTKADLLEAAKGLEVNEDMTKQEILDVLYPEKAEARLKAEAEKKAEEEKKAESETKE